MRNNDVDTTFWVLLAVAVCLITFSWQLEASEYNGEHWQSPFNYYVHMDCPAYVKTAVETALNKHSPVEHRYITITGGTASQNQRNEIYCGLFDAQESMLQVIPVGMSYAVEEGLVAGRARWYYFEKQQKIVECDVWFSDVFVNEDNVERIALHEVTGHCMGLKHLPNPNALMYFAVGRADFHIDDYAELADLYNQCPDKDFIDSDGNKFMARLDVEDLLARLDRREHDLYRGVELQAKQLVGTEWPAGLTEIKESECQ